MFIHCVICTESIKSDHDVVVTSCGHCFHNSCITNWFNTSLTCATCRQPSRSSSLIKLYFSNCEENKISELYNELLSSNAKLIKELDDLKEANKLQSEQIRETNEKFKSVNEDLKSLERTKQCDDMALAGYRAIKDESEKEIVRLKEQVNTLSLDLLAEKQLRRIHQTTLNQLEPKNPSYDISTVLNDQSISKGPSIGEDKNRNYSITPFWQLNCEASKTGAIPKEISKEPIRQFVIPNKIQKAELPLSMQQPDFKFRRFYKSSALAKESQAYLNRFRSSSPGTAFNMTSNPFYYQSQSDSQSRNLFKFGDGSATIAQNGFQLPTTSSSTDNNDQSTDSMSRHNNPEVSTSTASSSSSRKFTFGQKISDR